jgi:TRAP-type mannitol/chloroaromatic compound transport system permease small subunit
MTQFVYAIESLSIWFGRAFGWCILVLTFSVSYEVFVRYVLNAPTVWAFDMMIQMYGALFLMAGPYALAQDTHVRGDVLYRLFPVRWQARVDLNKNKRSKYNKENKKKEKEKDKTKKRKKRKAKNR